MSLSKSKGKSDNQEEVEAKIQIALETLHKIGSALKVDTSTFTFHPDQPECDKLFAAYYKKQKHAPTYSSTKTITYVGGRILYTAVCNHAKLVPQCNTSGCVLWDHGWGSNLKCYHGEVMCRKKNEIEMAVTSEAGSTALKEGRGIVEMNRFNRQVVKIVQENFVICMEDANQRFNQPSASSCGLSFTDLEKARVAMENSKGLTEQMFPNAKMGALLFMPVHCECNPGGKMLLGRQIAKITPFSLSGTEGLKEADVSPIQAVSVRHPAVFVFQCCNASGGKGKAGCDFKLSHPDLLQILNMVRKMWLEVMGSSLPITFPRFKWHQSLRVQSALLPEGPVNEEENPFGIDEEQEEEEEAVPPSPPPKKRVKTVEPKKKKRAVLVESSDEEE
ncbi:DBP [Lizard adenovirus 2]|uniref:DBP n=1 Tax=Lizard adenovirus 2 TaxID=874272 RepID=A0A076FTB4_9ADEN|nr:DBP [Lizard adenovirus 2]AII22573.1 DBP [Lizard adenovirus 2]